MGRMIHGAVMGDDGVTWGLQDPMVLWNVSGCCLM